MALQDVSDRQEFSRIESGQRDGSVGLVLVVALLLVAAAIGLVFIGRDQAATYILILLAALAVVGVFSLFAGAAGILRLAGNGVTNPLLKAVVEMAHDGIVVTDPRGRVVYANAAYLSLINAGNETEARPVERVFVGDPDISEAVYRLVKAAREGRRLQEEVRVPGGAGEPARWLRFRVRPLGEKGGEALTTVWSVADITRDRERQENIFQELQHAIDYLDHAPAGFFSVNGTGELVYLNATLATWLDYDLAQVGSGGLKLQDLVSGDGAALLTTLGAGPGDVKTEVLDLDLRTRGGRPLPVRLFHKVAFAADGSPGASRTLVLNRARDDGSDPQRAAEVRFMRFFHNAPMAIATLDREGRVMRSNAPFARFHHGVVKGEASPAEGRSILPLVVERDRPAVAAAVAKAADGEGDIQPFDVTLSDGDGDRSARLCVSAVESNEP
ncbi:MAG: PAS domain-containing protein, partial [Variibacter sp.]